MLGKRKRGRPKADPEDNLRYSTTIRYGDYESGLIKQIRYYTNERESKIFRAGLEHYLADLKRKHSF